MCRARSSGRSGTPICSRYLGPAKKYQGDVGDGTLDQRRILQRRCMPAYREIETLADDVDVAVGRDLDDADLRMTIEEYRQQIPEGELCNLDGRRQADHAAGLRQPLADRLFGDLRAAQRRDGVFVELLADVGHAELTRSPVEETNAQRRLQFLNAMAQSRLRQSQARAGGGESTPVDDLNEIEDILQVQHGPASILRATWMTRPAGRVPGQPLSLRRRSRVRGCVGLPMRAQPTLRAAPGSSPRPGDPRRASPYPGGTHGSRRTACRR